MVLIFNENVLYGIHLELKRVLWHLSSTKMCFIAFIVTENVFYSIILNENVFYGIYLQRKYVLWHLCSTKTCFM